MSRVFLAHEAALGRRVAIKVLSPDLAAGVSGDRFRREILLLAKLQHPHIVPVHIVGEATGLPYFTMPYVEGESLRTRIARDGELPIPEAMRLLRDVASALAYAHGQGIMHRDIKPDNVLLSAGSAVVADFGVAKAISDASTTGHVALTSTGIALGTPAYMAPEQAVGDATMDARVDIYAFGVMAYEMLTGRAPFQGRTAQATLAAHVTEPPEPIQHLRPSIPAALAALVMRCLEKHPADRPANAGDILHAIDSMATPVSGSTPTVPVPIERRTAATATADTTARRVPMPMMLALGLGLVALGVAIIFRSRPEEVNGPASAVSTQVLADSSQPDTSSSPVSPPSQQERAAVVTPPSAAPARGGPSAATPSPVQAAPDTTMAVQLRAAALDARSVSSQAGATAGQLAVGDSLLAHGDAMRRGRKYAEAGMAYSAARAAWTGLSRPAEVSQPASPPPSPPAPPETVTRRPEARPAVEAWLASYASAIESENTTRIRQVYPGLTASQEQDWHQFFDAVQGIDVTLSIASLQASGDSADASVTGSYAYQNVTTGRAERQPVSLSIRFALTDGRWAVVRLR
jgi:serine/threonine protein kinase